MNITTCQEDIWLKLLKFDAPQEHLTLWERQIKTAVNYQKVIDGLTNEKLTPLWQQARRNKSDPAPAAKADPVLKNKWREEMDFAPSAAHLALVEKLIEKETNLDGYFAKVTVETLVEIIREVAKGAKPEVVAPQPNLNLPEGK